MKYQTKKYLYILLSVFIGTAFCCSVSADIISSLDSQISGKKSAITELEQKATLYQQKITKKRSEAQSLANTIEILNAEINKIETEIEITETNIDQRNLEILELTAQIDQKEKEILHKQSIVADIIKHLYEYDQESMLEIILKYDNFADIFNQLEYTENLQAEISHIITELTEVKAELNNDKIETEQIKSDLEVKKLDLDEQKINLDKQNTLKQSLLTQTKNKESEYQRLLAQLEKEKQSILGDINQLMIEKSAELARIQAIQARPTSGLASTKWYFSQKDPTWGEITIGASNSKMTDYGCAISSVAMVFKYYGYNITPGRLAKEPIYLYNLIKWPSEWGDIKLVSSTSHNGVDWNKIDQEIANNHPVIVFVRANDKGGGHYVVIHSKDNDGKYVVHDPYWGANIFLDSTIQNISVLYNTTVSIDQMIIYH